ncbi:C-3 sterol dehydrogenase/C-4 decarboxylase family protein [Diaporthe helianthi]|uniref:C-3 sterol dehydrogenase/C-4 decarboxylase family protein n=1 Tax=Diaporthe helianthi TaxID=158607 RepID=A0A2P5HWT9_DIAHE|nr:C-3 sterol dehydrogenase/C-4 decarboxylase family protein [Diaporthe helianthi]
MDPTGFKDFNAPSAPPAPPKDKGKAVAVAVSDKTAVNPRALSLPDHHLGTVLVTGGCGFLGTHLVRQLLNDPECGTVHVIDKKISRNVIFDNNVQYTKCDITDTNNVEAILRRVQPKVIFHTASPNAIYERRRGFWRGHFYHTNVTGTANLLRLSKMPWSTVKVFVYTSSPCVYKDDHQKLIRESAPTYNSRPWPWEGVCESVWTKGVAHNMVLDENESWRKGGLKTIVVVPGIIYGIGDSQALPLIFDAFQSRKRPFMIVGRGDNKASFVEGTNCAKFHIVAARMLVAGGKHIAGQAFNATDGGDDVPIWWHVGITCAAIRGLTHEAATRERCIMIRPWMMCISVHVVWWLLLIFTLGYVEPPLALSLEGYKWATKDRMLNNQSARRLLGYEPDANVSWHEDLVREAVERERQYRRMRREGQRRPHAE